VAAAFRWFDRKATQRFQPEYIRDFDYSYEDRELAIIRGTGKQM
jgi:hypothetical protein